MKLIEPQRSQRPQLSLEELLEHMVVAEEPPLEPMPPDVDDQL